MYFNFDKSNTFCISLQSRNDRWEKIEKRFKLLNLDVTRVNAVCNENEIDGNYVYYLSLLQKFCTQSHINIWKFIVNNNIPYALILEDDACFDKNWKLKLDRFQLSVNNPYWEAIFLNASEALTDDKLYKWVLADEQYLCGGYILSLLGAKNLLKMFNDCYYMSDWMTTRLQKNGNSYTYFPWLIIQEGNESTIGSNYNADHLKVLDCLKKIDYSLDNYII